MKNTLLAGVLLAIGAWTAGASAQPQPVTVTLVNNQIPDVAPIVVDRTHGAQCRHSMAAAARRGLLV